MPLYRIQELTQFLSENGLQAKKGLSQNFLIDKNILSKMLVEANVQEGDSVLEIGPGPGVLTEALLLKGARVTAIEKDVNFARLLPRLGKEYPGKLYVHQGDALECELQKFTPLPSKIVANLPYQITAPILGKLLPLFPFFSSITVMVQKEVGERMSAQSGSKAFGHFSLFCQSYAKISYCSTVKNTCFFPAPKVDSAIVHCEMGPPIASDMEHFLQFSRIAFQHKRKTLKANLKYFYPKEKVEQFFEEQKLEATIRAEQISAKSLHRLWEKLTVFLKTP